ncbi:MAG: outer membrane protein assembly factor BamB family protein [Planctomycetota bacterium]|jgi:outer membrane protein assembly factor BamB
MQRHKLLLLLPVLWASTWNPADARPCLAGDASHAGVANEGLSTPLWLVWQYEAAHPPSPAFRGGLAPSRREPRVESITYDYVYEPVVAEGRLYFSSSTEEAVFCLDATDGKPLWTFHAEGPVRLAPCFEQGRLHFGSDDGHVYCLRAATGDLLWRFRAAPDKRRAIGNGRMISAWPVRTSVAVTDGAAHFGAGLFPTLGTYLFAVDAEKGELIWKRQIPYSPHGEIVVDGDVLLAATGRTAPAEFRRSDGRPRVEVPDPRRALGGSFVGKLNDMLVWGPDESGVTFFRVSEEPVPNRRPQDESATVAGRVTGLKAHAAVADERLYLIGGSSVLAVEWDVFQAAAAKNVEIRRRPWEKNGLLRYDARPYGFGRAGLPVLEDQVLLQELQENAAWSVPNEHALTAAILAGDKLVAGGADRVVVLDTGTGQQLWSHAVEGEARGLAVAAGSLYVSTDRGRILCFRGDRQGTAAVHKPAPAKPYPHDPVVADLAKTALEHADVHKGFCLVLGAGTGQLAWEIARRSELFVVAVDEDPAGAAEARTRLTEAGIYGQRVVVRQTTRDDPPYPPHFANLIVSEECLRTGRMPYPGQTVMRLLQPYGGTIVLGGSHGLPVLFDGQADGLSQWKQVAGSSGARWHVAHRGSLAGAGQWTHMYANPANTVSSGDRLVGSEHALQWFGPPGAEDVVERHAVAMPPLFGNGKLFVAGLYDTVQAIDAYNGTRLWKIEVPESTRMMLSHNAGFMAAGDDVLFVAADHACWMLDAATGAVLHAFVGPSPSSDWGYVGTVGGYLVGTNQKEPADEYSGGRRREGYRFLVAARDLHSRPTVSENLFVYDCQTRELAWKHDGPTAILNPTITVGGDRVYFAESRTPQIVDDPSGTADLADFFADGARLVALDLHSGEPVWTRPLAPLSPQADDRHEHIMFLSFADGLLLSTRTGHVGGKLAYRLRALDAGSGDERWSRTVASSHRVYAPLSYGKNGQQSHPAIVDGRVYLLSHITGALITLDLKTGRMEQNPELFKFWIHSKTCAVPTASAGGLYFRRNSCYLYDLGENRPIDLTAVTRPSCWMSIIPAGGLVLMPEASSGCTCGFALQTSVVLAPAIRRPP